MGFSKGWQGCSEGFPEEQPCQPEENHNLPDSFTLWRHIVAWCMSRFMSNNLNGHNL